MDSKTWATGGKRCSVKNEFKGDVIYLHMHINLKIIFFSILIKCKIQL